MLQVVNFCQDPPRLAPPYSIARLAGIETDEKLEEKEVKEGGGEERVDSSESDEPKVKITRDRNWLQISRVYIFRWVQAWTSSQNRGRKVSA